MNEKLVLHCEDGPVEVLMLNRPEKRNALSRALMAELIERLDEIDRSPLIRSVILMGAGTVFCSGMDLGEVREELAAERLEETGDSVQFRYAGLLQAVRGLSKPIIAVVNGDALAGGAGLIAACDFAIASNRARIGYPEVLRGLVPAVIMPDLVRLIGDRRARRMLLTGEPIDAMIASEWGLVNAVTEPSQALPEALKLAHALVRSAPAAVAAIKQTLDEMKQGPFDLRDAAAFGLKSRDADEVLEGVRAFLEKRSPAWQETQV
jgi:methylglutaconyl-CoA hydratase